MALSPVPGGPSTGSFSWDTVVARLRAALGGEFEILVELGRGGFAAVHLAHERSLNRRVALKVMSPAVLMGDGMLERAQQEAVTHANLVHPNIVPVHGMRVVDELFLVIMQYVPGRSLQQVVRAEADAGRTIPLDVIRAVLFQVGAALSYAHRRGVVHRDIKPANILLSADGDAVVTDFGIAKVSESQSHTLTGTVMGTAQYMSPEQCFAAKVTGASDQYSLGVVAYELLTGHTPFSGSTFVVMQAHTAAAPQPPRTLRPDCPADMEAAVLRMLAKVPEDRFATIPDALVAMGARQPSTLDDDPVRLTLVGLAAVEQVERKLGIRAAPSNVPRTPLPSAEAAMPNATSPPARRQEPARITLTLPAATLAVGDVMALSAVVRSHTDEVLSDVPLRWTATNPAVARIDPASGQLTAISAGPVFIAVSAGEAMATARVDVLAREAITAVPPRDLPDLAPVPIGEREQAPLARWSDQKPAVPEREVPEANPAPSGADLSVERTVGSIGTATTIGSSVPREAVLSAAAQPVQQGALSRDVKKRPDRWRVLALLAGIAAVVVVAVTIFNRPPESPPGVTNPLGTRPNLDSMYRAALATLSVGETLSARETLRSLVTLDSAGSNPDARDLLSRLDTPERPPPNLDSISRAALTALRRRDTLSAIEDLRRLVTLDSGGSNPDARELLSRLLARQRPNKTADPTTALATRVSVSANARLEVGERISATATVVPASRGTVQWTSSNRAIASVDAAGRIVALSAGTVRIAATADTARGEVVITVTDSPVASLRLDGASRLQVGATTRFTANAENRRGAVVPLHNERWQSANPSVATVDNTGRVRAIGAGSTEISLNIGEVRGSRSLTVEAAAPPPPPPPESTRISPQFTAQDGAAAARWCGDALRTGAAGISAQFEDNPGRANLLQLLAQGGVRLSANDDRAAPQGEATSTRASVTFPAASSYRTRFGQDKNSSFSVTATTRVQDGRWTPVSCVIAGAPKF